MVKGIVCTERFIINKYHVVFIGGNNRLAVGQVIISNALQREAVTRLFVCSNAYIEINQLPTPEKDGYTFGGWFLDSNFKNKITLPFAVTEEIRLYAKWIPNDSTSGNLGLILGLTLGLGGGLILTAVILFILWKKKIIIKDITPEEFFAKVKEKFINIKNKNTTRQNLTNDSDNLNQLKAEEPDDNLKKKSSTNFINNDRKENSDDIKESYNENDTTDDMEDKNDE